MTLCRPWNGISEGWEDQHGADYSIERGQHAILVVGPDNNVISDHETYEEARAAILALGWSGPCAWCQTIPACKCAGRCGWQAAEDARDE